MGWLLAGWFALSVVAAAAFHIVRSRYRPVSIPREVSHFLCQLEREIRDKHPHVQITGMLPGRFAAVFAIRGQECPVSLHLLFRRCVAFPDEFPETVSRFLDEIETDGLDAPTDHALADVATSILPQIRLLSWVEAHGGLFGDGALVHRGFSDDLVICYVIDEPWCMTFICQAHLRQWQISEEDLFHLATRNLHRLAGDEIPMPGDDGEPVLLKTGDGFDAARVLLLDPDKVDGVLVGMPERDVLWLGKDDGPSATDLAQLMTMNEQQSQRAAHPVSPHLYRMQRGHLVPVTDRTEE